MDKLKVVILSGSVRENSETSRVVPIIQRYLEQAGFETAVVDPSNLPIFKDVETPEAEEFLKLSGECDAFVVVTPEYHGSFSGVLKNAIDYLDDEVELVKKPVGLVGVSSGFGGTRPLTHLRDVFRALDAVVIPMQVAVFRSKENVGDDFNLPALKSRAETLAKELHWYATILKQGRNS